MNEKEIPQPEVEESGEYENFVGNRDKTYEAPSLTEFLEGEEEDNEDVVREWQKHWKQMPEYNQDTNSPYKKLIVSFRTEEDYKEFGKIVGNEHISDKTKSIWYPKLLRTDFTLERYMENPEVTDD